MIEMFVNMKGKGTPDTGHRRNDVQRDDSGTMHKIKNRVIIR